MSKACVLKSLAVRLVPKIPVWSIFGLAAEKADAAAARLFASLAAASDAPPAGVDSPLGSPLKRRRPVVMFSVPPASELFKARTAVCLKPFSLVGSYVLPSR